MNTWTVEVHLDCIETGERRTIVRGDEDVEMVLQLAKIDAMFVLDGVRYHSNRPTVDPINRKLMYWCEGYRV